MILQYFFDIVKYILLFIVNLLPVAQPLPVDATNALSSLFGVWQWTNSLLPVDTMLIILTTGLLFEAGILGFKIINWLIKKLTFSG